MVTGKQWKAWVRELASPKCLRHVGILGDMLEALPDLPDGALMARALPVSLCEVASIMADMADASARAEVLPAGQWGALWGALMASPVTDGALAVVVAGMAAGHFPLGPLDMDGVVALTPGLAEALCVLLNALRQDGWRLEGGR